jgi:uncharacterized protein (DUF1800 family)
MLPDLTVHRAQARSRRRGHAFSWWAVAALFAWICLIISLPAQASSFAIDRPMDEAAARAMLNRFGYGADIASLDATLGQTPRQYLNQALAGGSHLPPGISGQIQSLPIAEPLDAVWSRLGPGGSEADERKDPDTRKTMQKTERDFAAAAIQARLLTMANSDNPGHEVLLSFWLNHFSIYAPKNFDKLLAWDYARTIESAMAEDSFEALLRASFYHPAMQIYLDNAQSAAPSSQAARRVETAGKKQPGINENLARELMELHTLGVGAGYTQQDVQQLARIITGAGVYSPRMRDRALERAGTFRNDLFLFDPRRHDFGAKTLLGVSFPAGVGKDEIDRALHLLATHPATARRVALKLARRFLADDPPAQVVEAMSQGFLRSGGRLSATLEPLLASRAFADSLSAPAKFKEPLDYLLSSVRATCSGSAIGNGKLLSAAALDMGEAPFMRTTPDGYGSQSADWLSPAAMAKRVRLALGLATEKLALASGQQQGGGMPLRPQFDDTRLAWTRGATCAPVFAEVARLVGPLSEQSRQAAAGLAERERVAFILASPEFMRR